MLCYCIVGVCWDYYGENFFQDNQQYYFNNLANARIKSMVVVKEDAFKRKYNRREKI